MQRSEEAVRVLEHILLLELVFQFLYTFYLLASSQALTRLHLDTAARRVISETFKTLPVRFGMNAFEVSKSTIVWFILMEYI